MAIATIETPQGQVVRLEVPDGATEDQILQFVQSQDLSQFQAPQQTGVAPGASQEDQQSIAGIARDTALEFMSGVNRGALSLFDIPSDIANAVLELSGSEVRAPTLREQELISQGISGGFLQNPLAAQAVGMIGEFVAPAPAVAAKAETLADALPSPSVLGAVDQGLDPIEAVVQTFTQQSPTKQKIAQKILQEPQSTEVVKFVRDGAGRISRDKAAIETIRQGFDEGVIAAIKGASGADRKIMQDMLKRFARGRTNARFAAKNRPSDLAGNAMVERIKHVSSVNRQAGQAIDREARKLKGETADFTGAVDSFLRELNDAGITVRQSSTGRLRANFAGSDIEDSKEAEQAIALILKRISDGPIDSAEKFHRLRRLIDDKVTFGKCKEGLAGVAERMLKRFRSGIRETMNENFPAYAEANKLYSETIGALDAFQDAAGRKVNLFGENADKAIGTSLRRLLSNTQSRANMVDAISDVERVAKSTGAQFDDDILNLMLFADELDSRFGPTARTSLAGETQKAVEAVARTRGPSEIAVEAVARGAEKIRGINDENAIKALRELLER